MVRVKKQFKDPSLKACPFCKDNVIVIADIDYEDGLKDGFRILCKCGWSKRIIRWHKTKEDLINNYNELVQEGEFCELLV